MLGRLNFAAAALLATAPAAAAPWLAPGDDQLRGDIEWLAAHGAIDGPVNAWPLPVTQLCRRGAPVGGASAADAARRIAAACTIAKQHSGAEARVGLATDPPVTRGFADAPRANSDLAVAFTQDIGRLHLRLGLGHRDGKLNAEPSYLALDLGGWALYGGYVEHWWGPGRENALLLSTNAAPFPKLGVRRTTPAPLDLPLLSALGPVGVELFAGVLTEQRRDFDNPGLIGMRVAFAPVAGLEIGLNRALQLCGDGRPCNLRLIANGLIGIGDRDNSGTANEPGNQLAGVDLSYRRMIGGVAAHAYVAMAAEDENNLIVEQFGRLGGFEISGSNWQVHAEAADTLAVKLFGGKDYPGSFYNHHIYTDGFRYRRRALGSSLDGDGRMLVVAGSVTDADDRRAYASVRNVDLNRSGNPNNPLTSGPVSFNQLTGGIELPALAGRLRLEARVADGSAEANGVAPRAQLELSFRIRR